MLSKERLAELQRLNDTVPPWMADMKLLWAMRDGKWATGLGVLTEEDAELAVVLREQLPLLLDHIAAQEALIDRLTKALEEIRNGTDDVMVENAAYVALADVRSATNG